MIIKCFKGANVFLSRNFVPMEKYAAIYDALKHHGAEIIPCCDPSRSGPNDYHVISSPEHEKFEVLKAKGCKMLGPECVLFCAKENRELPNHQGFTCCLGLDGEKILASGFEEDEKVTIEKLVTSMGGVLQTRPSSDVSSVIVKNVLARDYRWALTNVKKPIVTISWLYQCWKEHRFVPHESYRVLPFSGLMICATQIKLEVRKEMQKLILQNGGTYSADLTKQCTHLVSDVHTKKRNKLNQSKCNALVYVMFNNRLTLKRKMRQIKVDRHTPDDVALERDEWESDNEWVVDRQEEESVEENEEWAVEKEPPLVPPPPPRVEDPEPCPQWHYIIETEIDQQAIMAELEEEDKEDGGRKRKRKKGVHATSTPRGGGGSGHAITPISTPRGGGRSGHAITPTSTPRGGGGSGHATSSRAPEGDKYRAARTWRNVHIVTPKWIDQSIARRARLDEESYSVRGTSGSSASSVRRVSKGEVLGQQRHDKGNTNLLFGTSSATADLETTVSQNMSSTFSDSTIFHKDEGSEEPNLLSGPEEKLHNFVADDSQSEDNDLYLSDCRVLLVGFQVTEQRKLVNMVRRGGGSRYMAFNEKLTHIVVGTPSDDEKKQVRRYAASGVIYVVRTIWLEDCDRGKKEIPVSSRYISDLYPLKDPTCFNKANITSISGITQAATSMPSDHVTVDWSLDAGTSVEKRKGRKLSLNLEKSTRGEEAASSGRQGLHCSVKSESMGRRKSHRHSHSMAVQDKGPSKVFEGIAFCFSSSFPKDRRDEIIEWVDQGGGAIVDDQENQQNAQFTIECHGLMQRPANVSQTNVVSSHWIKFCLEVGDRLPVDSHIIYSPLPCQVPFPGFEGFRFCVSQYEVKDRILLRNLCYILGATFTEKLTKRVTHLICKFSGGPKYEGACNWGITSVTSEWIFQCIRLDKILPVDSFRPKDITSQDREAGLCTVSQYPTQAARMVSDADDPSQVTSQSQVLEKAESRIGGDSNSNKRVKHKEGDNHRDLHSEKSQRNVSIYKIDSMTSSMLDAVVEVSQAIPDVASAIEDLLAQSNKIQEVATPGITGPVESVFSPDCSVVSQDKVDSCGTFGISKQWSSRPPKQDDHCNPSVTNMNRGTYDGFSETQTESQVVGYEEDFSGIQKIIDRARTRSSLT